MALVSSLGRANSVRAHAGRPAADQTAGVLARSIFRRQGSGLARWPPPRGSEARHAGAASLTGQ
jgi:hypothetical protein